MKTKSRLPSIQLFVLFLAISITSPVNAAIRIMLLGDSLTQGEGSGIVDWDLQVAYREALWVLLNADGYDVDFVGSQDTGSAVFADSQHEGLGGRRADQIIGNIGGWLVANPAKIIFLHIGTNDINEPQAPAGIVTEVSQILDQIYLYDSDITVILALIINRKDYNCGNASTTTTFNDDLYDMAVDRISSGDRIEIVDMECGADIDYRDEIVGGDMYNGNDLHPVDSGYVKMADLWFFGFQAIQPSADAGSNQSANEFDLVTLDGSNSSDHFGAAVSYLWIQTSGTSVGSFNDSIARPTFEAPDVASGGETLTFQLTVTDPSGLEATDTTIVNVDNLPTCTLDSRFQETTLSNGIEYYTDRTYTVTSVPGAYVGMDMIKTPNDDRNLTTASDYLTFQLSSDATVYVAYDSRATSLPNWMSGFTNTGDRIYTSLATQPYLEVYSRPYYAGDCVNLGANKAPGFSGDTVSNYIVFYATWCPGDFDSDGDVDGSDISVFINAYAIGDLTADLDNSGVVDTNDLAIFAADFGRINCP